MFEKKDVWYIRASTGCTCCCYEDFNAGFYWSEESAQKVIDQWNQGNGNPLASQYAPYGRYKLVKTVAELLPDGRMIVSDEVYKQDHFGRVFE